MLKRLVASGMLSSSSGASCTDAPEGARRWILLVADDVIRDCREDEEARDELIEAIGENAWASINQALEENDLRQLEAQFRETQQ
jgi:hypothetical protein